MSEALWCSGLLVCSFVKRVGLKAIASERLSGLMAGFAARVLHDRYAIQTSNFELHENGPMGGS